MRLALRLIPLLVLLPAIAVAQRGRPSPLGLIRDARIVEAMRDLSPAELRRIDSTLVAFGTRHTMSDTLSPTRGIGVWRCQRPRVARWITSHTAASPSSEGTAASSR